MLSQLNYCCLFQLFYNRFFLNLTELSDDEIVSLTKNENGSVV